MLQWRIQDFPEAGAPTLRVWVPANDSAKISQKLHEIERIWTPRGVHVPRAPALDLPVVLCSLKFTLGRMEDVSYFCYHVNLMTEERSLNYDYYQQTAPNQFQLVQMINYD